MIALMAPGLMIADLCTSSDICTYGINATGLDTSMAPLTEDARNTWDLTFQFAGRDLYNDGPNTLLSFRVTGSPAAGWV